MPYTLGEAAKAAGKSKPTIQRAIKSGKISAKKNQDGSYSIEPVELDRVYPLVTRSSNDTGTMKQSVTPEETAVLQAKLEAAEQRIADKDRVIDYLQRNLDEEREERRKLTLMLTDQREKASKKPAEGFLDRLIGNHTRKG